MQPTDLPIAAVDSAALPAEVRNGTAEDRQLYSVALGFERMLVEQLTKQMTDSLTELGGDDEDGDSGFGSGSSSLFAEQLPGTMADAIASGGGLGLATELYRALAPEAGTTAAASPAGTEADTGQAGA